MAIVVSGIISWGLVIALVWQLGFVPVVIGFFALAAFIALISAIMER